MKSAVRTLEQAPVDIAESRLPPPILSYVGGRRWRLEADYDYRDAETTITVPKGFEFDLSSIPRLLWGLIAPFELRRRAAPARLSLLPRRQATDRHRRPVADLQPAEVDAMFRGIMRKEGVPSWRRALGYLAVRTFGRHAWRA